MPMIRIEMSTMGKSQSSLSNSKSGRWPFVVLYDVWQPFQSELTDRHHLVNNGHVPKLELLELKVE